MKLLFLPCLLLLSLTATAKVPASLKGKVTGQEGKPVPNVSIILQPIQPKMPALNMKVADNGTYSFNSLTNGEYTATFSAPGFESQRFTAIDVKDNALLLNVSLRRAGPWGQSLVSRRYEYEVAILEGRTKITRHKSGIRSTALKGAGIKSTRTISSYSSGEEGPAMLAPPMPARSPDRADYSVAPTSTRSMPTTAPDVLHEESDLISDKAPGHSIGTTDGIIAFASGRGSAAVLPNVYAGSLTSGEIDDFSKWTLWEDISMDDLKGYRASWPFRPEARYTIVVKSSNGAPLCNARVKMSNSKGAIWEAITDNTGKAELWYGIYDTAGAGSNLSATVEYGKQRFSLSSLKPFSNGVNMLKTNLTCLNPAKLDIAFLVDATGSMGDEISYLKAELRDILQKVKDSMPRTEVQTGALFYRDNGDEYLTRLSDLTSDFNKTEAFIADNEAGGGGDTPEGVDAALEDGLNALHWRTDATARLAFLVLDAPPHEDFATVKRMQNLTAQYAARGIRLIPVVCSGSDKPTEYLMRAIALATNGTYLFLTDHSGIGGSHVAPTTDKYDVEYLNGLIYRVIHQFAYMPSCTEQFIAGTDTTQVQQRTNSVTTINWSYYPNPSTGIVNIRHTNTVGYLLVTDITGKAILRIPTNTSGTTTIDLTQYPAGIYAIRYNWSRDKWVTGKFTLFH
jgi:hypothetical protein